ncbi:NlpC/P60 family protein [Actinoplanes sp. KI2]|uniref:C40 family peptidase n=1 Tax=Actinoplanes sp. KI2 TaxID=2983315 RepID=UPI0021D573E9|nr:C40 family peptidase [Actinoplanes sp. KI2]MCU7722202.1 NlpC/P60 family protein [Actinoplanes sp. KI2]
MLAVVTPAIEPLEQASAAAPHASSHTPPVADADRAESARIDPEAALLARAVEAQRASRTMRSTLRTAAGRTAGVRHKATPSTDRPTRTARAASADSRRRFESRGARSAHSHPAGRHDGRATRHGGGARHGTGPGRHREMRAGNLSAVVAYARSQLGKRYRSGGAGDGGFDCSGLTMSAYAKVGIHLPHSSSEQAARARSISRGEARAGDLVVGHGHVGIYMGHGMMIDAGNHRTGVVYREMYSGLRIERI